MARQEIQKDVVVVFCPSAGAENEKDLFASSYLTKACVKLKCYSWVEGDFSCTSQSHVKCQKLESAFCVCKLLIFRTETILIVLQSIP